MLNQIAELDDLDRAMLVFGETVREQQAAMLEEIERLRAQNRTLARKVNAHLQKRADRGLETEIEY